MEVVIGTRTYEFIPDSVGEEDNRGLLGVDTFLEGIEDYSFVLL